MSNETDTETAPIATGQKTPNWSLWIALISLIATTGQAIHSNQQTIQSQERVNSISTLSAERQTHENALSAERQTHVKELAASERTKTENITKALIENGASQVQLNLQAQKSEVDRELANQKTQVEMKSLLNQDKINSAKLFQELLGDLRHKDKSQGALLVLWLTYSDTKSRQVIIPAALLASASVTENLHTISLLGKEAKALVKEALKSDDRIVKQQAQIYISRDFTDEKKRRDLLSRELTPFGDYLRRHGVRNGPLPIPEFTSQHVVLENNERFIVPDAFEDDWGIYAFRGQILCNWAYFYLPNSIGRNASSLSVVRSEICRSIAAFAVCSSLNEVLPGLIGGNPWGTANQNRSSSEILKHSGNTSLHFELPRFLWDATSSSEEREKVLQSAIALWNSKGNDCENPFQFFEALCTKLDQETNERIGQRLSETAKLWQFTTYLTQVKASQK